jgi:cyclopropane-fatty-acyl-phospholipid synthase
VSTKRLLGSILSQITGACFTVRFWDGDSVRCGAGPEEFVLHLKDEAVCRSLAGNLDVGFGEAYASGAIEVDGDLQRLLRLMYVCRPETFSLGPREKVKLALLNWRHYMNPLEQARRNVAVHYDLGNEFFKLWLGKEMVYSCAYFRSAKEDIDTAQERKLDHICAKLGLREGARLLDIGCGWGGFLLHAAARYGAGGLGVTLSANQAEEARRRIAAHGLSDRINVELRDYRELAGSGYDAVVSIGMFEHVGLRNYSEYFWHTARMLRDGGIGVLHTIGRQVAAPPNPWIAKHIFPGAYFPSLAAVAAPLTASGLCITDVEVWRLHYALTLESWLKAYESNLDAIRRMYGEAFTRMWRLYLAGCVAGFRYGDHCVWQIQFTKGSSERIPLTRDYLYRSDL